MVAFSQYRLKLKKLAVQAACLMLVAVAVWGGVWIPGASAAGSREAGNIMNERAAAELDRKAGAGTSDQLKGNIDKTVGKTKRGLGRLNDNINDASDRNLGDKLGTKLDNAAKRLDGSTDELKGEIKRDVGRAKGATAEAGDDIKDKTNSVVESIKDFFD
jgi:uncharacterized protein YjbJ (UPF0337 family)